MEKVNALNEDYLIDGYAQDVNLTDNIIGRNQNQLQEFGIDSEGRPLEPPYSFKTVGIKREKGQEFNHVTLKDTGVFYDSMFISTSDSGLKFDGDTQKDDNDLRDKYGDDILGLTDENLQQSLPEFIRVGRRLIRKLFNV